MSSFSLPSRPDEPLVDEVVVVGELAEESGVGADGPVRPDRLQRLVRRHPLKGSKMTQV